MGRACRLGAIPNCLQGLARSSFAKAFYHTPNLLFGIQKTIMISLHSTLPPNSISVPFWNPAIYVFHVVRDARPPAILICR